VQVSKGRRGEEGGAVQKERSASSPRARSLASARSSLWASALTQAGARAEEQADGVLLRAGACSRVRTLTCTHARAQEDGRALRANARGAARPQRALAAPDCWYASMSVRVCMHVWPRSDSPASASA